MMKVLAEGVKLVKEGPEQVTRLKQQPGGVIMWGTTLFLAALLSKDVHQFLWFVPLLPFVVYALSRTGSILDYLYDKAFAPETDNSLPFKWFGTSMRTERLRAALFLRSSYAEDSPITDNDRWESIPCRSDIVEGIYGKSNGLYVGTADWKSQVKRWLEISKATRSFILPCAVACVAAFWPAVLPRIAWPLSTRMSFMIDPKYWPVPLSATILLLFLSTAFRIRHLRNLYHLVADKEHTKRTQMRVPLGDPAWGRDGKHAVFSSENCLVLIKRLLNESSLLGAELEIRLVYHRDSRLIPIFPLLFKDALIRNAK
jgi:hypothetical protein